MKQLVKRCKRTLLRGINALGYAVYKLPPRPSSSSRIKSIALGGRTIRIYSGNPLCHAYQQNPQYNFTIGVVAAMVQKRFPDAWAVDVGANVGDTLAIIKSNAAAMPVICIEGDPICFELLQDNARQFEAVFPVKAFLSDQPGTARVECHKAGWNTTLTEAGSDGRGQPLEFQTLDQVVERLNGHHRVKLLKVDTEGYDIRILRGAARILGRHRPVITFELNRENVEPLGDSVGDFIDYLVNSGYGHFILNDSEGRFICALNGKDKAALLDLYQYSNLGRPIYYYDIWVFHLSDGDLFEDFLAQERARS